MEKKIDEKDLTNRVSMYFFSPLKSPNEYRIEYKLKYGESHIKKYGGLRFSPLYLLRKDVYFCLGSYGLSRKNIGQNTESALFAGILLINIAFTNLTNKLFDKNYTLFAKKYMGIEREEELKALRLLRNALEHNNYSLFYRYRDRDKKTLIKIYFSINLRFAKLIEKDVTWKTKYPSELYKINPRKLHMSLEKGISRLKIDILKKGSFIYKKFIKNIRLKDWTLWDN